MLTPITSPVSAGATFAAPRPTKLLSQLSLLRYEDKMSLTLWFRIAEQQFRAVGLLDEHLQATAVLSKLSSNLSRSLEFLYAKNERGHYEPPFEPSYSEIKGFLLENCASPFSVTTAEDNLRQCRGEFESTEFHFCFQRDNQVLRAGRHTRTSIGR